jgi:hypothetical protein
MKSNRTEWLSVIFTILLQAVIFIPYLFGLGFSFYRFGTTDGIISVVIPPYAWYRGISYLWVEPKWQEDWDMKTETLAFLITNTGSDDPRVELEFRQYEGQIKKWISKIPDEERSTLQSESEAFGKAFIAYQEAFMDYLIEPQEAAKIWETPSIQQYVAEFENETGFMEIWDKMKTDHKYVIEMLQKQMEHSDASPEELRDRMEDFKTTQGSILLAMSGEKITTRINKLFEQ